MSQQSLESIYNNKQNIKRYDATESAMKPPVVSESHEKFKPMRNPSSKSGPSHTYEAGENFMKYSAQDYSRIISRLSPRQYGAYVKCASISDEKAANFLHTMGNAIDSAGQGIYNAGKAVYDTGAAANRGVRNVGNSIYNYGQSVARMPGAIGSAVYKGVTGGLGDHKDVAGSGTYGKPPAAAPNPAAQTAPAMPRTPAAPPAMRQPGTYVGGIRTQDENGADLQLNPADQQHVNSVNRIRDRMSGGSAPVGPAPAPAPAPAPSAPPAGVAINPANGKPNLSWQDEQKLRESGGM